MTRWVRRSVGVQAEEGATHEEHAVDIVDVPMFPAAIMNVIPRHADLRTVEDGGLSQTLS